MPLTIIRVFWVVPVFALFLSGCHQTPQEAQEPQGQSDFVDPGENWKHPIAGRSPFPEADEKFDRPIPAKRLSDEDQFAKPVDAENIPDVVPWDQASRYVGHEITVEGRIVHLGKSGKVNFLNFDKDWRGKFYVVIFDDLATTLDAGVEETFKGKLIRVKGVVENFRGKPQMKISSMDQVEFRKE